MLNKVGFEKYWTETCDIVTLGSFWTSLMDKSFCTISTCSSVILLLFAYAVELRMILCFATLFTLICWNG